MSCIDFSSILRGVSFAGMANNNFEPNYASLDIVTEVRMSYRKWTDSQLKDAVKTSTTISDVVRKIGLKSNNSGNHQTVRY